jgi:hypothetical protein
LEEDKLVLWSYNRENVEREKKTVKKEKRSKRQITKNKKINNQKKREKETQTTTHACSLAIFCPLP